MTLLDPIMHSPRMPQYVAELAAILEAEREKRRRFFEELREDQKAEFINGEVIVHSPVKLEHENASSNLYKLLSVYVELHSIGHVTHEKILVCLTRNDYEPDICYFNAAKAAGFTSDQMKFPAPDLAVEVLSPSTEKTDRTLKFEDYASHEVNEYWIVDPRGQTIEQYLLGAGRYELALKVKDGSVKSRAIEGLEIPVLAAFDGVANLQALRAILGT